MNEKNLSGSANIEGIDDLENEAGVDVKSIDDALDITAPESGGVKSKGLPLAAKITGGLMVVGLLTLVGLNMIQPEQTISTQQAGQIGVKIDEAGNFKNAQASQSATNPEAAELSAAVGKREIEALRKDPSKSIIDADPFGNAEVGNEFNRDNGNNGAADQLSGLTTPTAPPEFDEVSPRPTEPAPGTNSNGEDPVLAYARKVYDDSTFSPTAFVSPGNTKPATSSSEGSLGASGAEAKKATAAADFGTGEIVYAEITSGVNSLVPQTPARAIIHGGKLNGAIALGKVEEVEGRYMVFKFNTITLNKKTYPIQAIGLNANDVQDAGLVDRVRDRGWERAVLQAGVKFTQAFGAAKLEEGTTSNQTGFGGTSSSVPKRSNGETAVIALGGAAQGLGELVDKKISSMRDEVIVNQRKEVGILFLQPLTLE